MQKMSVMDSFEKRKLKLYGLFWAAVLVIPTLPLVWGALGITGNFSSFEEVFSLWLTILPIFVLFLVHNFLVLPLYKKSLSLYAVAAFLLVVLFGIYCFTVGDHPPGLPKGVNPTVFDPPSHQPARPAAMLLGFGVLAIFANLGANAIVEQERKDAERRLLEIENLKLQLETLRYQINPHFFLNTLNNIQALVLIDPDKATESISTFSKMMQMVLRDAKAPIALLSDEVCFLEYFIKLMRLRFTDDVQIDTRFPDETGDAVIQPLILTTFVENAFKHGISYEHPSFVRVQIELRDGTIVFRCENSLHSDSHPEGYGIGLVNARERLSLQYGDQFKLNARAKEDSFVVELTLPEHIDFPAV